MNKRITIAIDGPAGAGKSTIGKIIAQKINADYIDTGAMYRALTLKLIENNIDLNDTYSLLKELNNTSIDFRNGHIYLDKKIVDKQIRENIVSQNVSDVAKIKEVREELVKIQQNIASQKSVVMDGRDFGTVVLPNADFKFFVIASIHERAKRRFEDLVKAGEKNLTIEEVEDQISRRDKIDSTREKSPLTKSDDAYEIDTTNKSINESVDEILKIIEGR